MTRILAAATAALAAWMLYWSSEYTDRASWLITLQQSVINEYVIPKRPPELSEADFASAIGQILEENKKSAQFARDTLPYAREDLKVAGNMLTPVPWIAALILALGWAALGLSHFKLRIERRRSTTRAVEMAHEQSV